MASGCLARIAAVAVSPSWLQAAISPAARRTGSGPASGDVVAPGDGALAAEGGIAVCSGGSLGTTVRRSAAAGWPQAADTNNRMADNAKRLRPDTVFPLIACPDGLRSPPAASWSSRSGRRVCGWYGRFCWMSLPRSSRCDEGRVVCAMRRNHVPVAQWTEQAPSKRKVAGSNPAGDATSSRALSRGASAGSSAAGAVGAPFLPHRGRPHGRTGSGAARSSQAQVVERDRQEEGGAQPEQRRHECDHEVHVVTLRPDPPEASGLFVLRGMGDAAGPSPAHGEGPGRSDAGEGPRRWGPEPVEVEFEVEVIRRENPDEPVPGEAAGASSSPSPPRPKPRSLPAATTSASIEPSARARPVTPIAMSTATSARVAISTPAHAVGRVGIDMDRRAGAVAPLDRDRVGGLRRDGARPLGRPRRAR